MPTLWPEDLHHDMIGARHGGLVAQPRTRLAAERGQGAKAVSRSDGRGKLSVRRNGRQRRGRCEPFVSSKRQGDAKPDRGSVSGRPITIKTGVPVRH
jgi:hypothetical protein